MNLKMKIEPVVFWQQQATYLAVDLVQIKQFNDTGSANVVWRLTNEADENLKSGSLTLVSEEYSQWGVDDDYILTVVANRLGLTLINV